MAKIYDRVEKKFVNVQSMRNLLFHTAPKYEFFLHKRYKDKGYTVSERTTGCAVAHGETQYSTIMKANEKLDSLPKGELDNAVKRAMEVQENDKTRV